MARTSFWRQSGPRLSRRRFLAGMGAGAAALAVAVACGESARPVTTPASPPASSRGTRGGQYIFSVPADWGTLDPVTSVGFATYVFPLVYNVLVDRSRVDSSFYYFDLAETLEQPDEETYAFTIRPGVTVAPNSIRIPERALDAFDTETWLARVESDPTAVSHSFVSRWVSSFQAPDERTLTVRSDGPYAYFLFRIGSPLGGTIPPREFFEQELSLADRGAGAGPFVIEPDSYAETGGIRLARNANYYRTGADGDPLPYLDEIAAVRLSDRLPRRVAFGDRQIHTYDAVDLAEVHELQGSIPGVQVVEEPVNTFVSFVMNPTRAPWNDDRIRRAALHALDRQQFVDLIVGPDGGEPDGLVHWPLRDFALPADELRELQPFDPAEARRLIRAATGEDSIDIDVVFPVTDDEFLDQHAPIFVQQMKEAGFNVRQEALDIGTWLTRYLALDYTASLSLNQVYETAETPLDFHSADGPLGTQSYAVGIGRDDPQIEEAIQASKRTSDPVEHRARVLDAQRLIYSGAPASLPIMSWMNFTLYHEFVGNVPQGLGSTGRFLTNEMWLEPDGSTAR